MYRFLRLSVFASTLKHHQNKFSYIRIKIGTRQGNHCDEENKRKR
jgi:hypothetical protein